MKHRGLSVECPGVRFNETTTQRVKMTERKEDRCDGVSDRSPTYTRGD